MGAERDDAARLKDAVLASGDAAYEWHLETDALHWLTEPSQLLTEASSGIGHLARLSPAFVKKLRDAHAKAAQRGGTYACVYEIVNAHGEPTWIEDRGRVDTDASGARTALGTLRCLPSRDTDNRAVDIDTLTAQYNSRQLQEALAHALDYSRRNAAVGLFAKIGIDNLSLIEDTYGTDVAERAVIAVNRELDRCLNPSDVLARTTRTEFGAVLNRCDALDISTTVERLMLAVQQASIVTEDGHLPVMASVGAISLPSPSVQGAGDAFAKADVALEQARRSGANCFSVYDLSGTQLRNLRNDMALAQHVSKALKERRFRLHYQPVVRADGRDIAFFECLVRMVDLKGLDVVAGQFMPVAERMGLARPIDRLVLELTLEELLRDETVSLSVNISALSTTDPSWFRILTNRIGNRRDLGARLLIEITETTALHDLTETMRFISAVKGLGCRVALDDFGAGYTSFRHLQELAVDVVKIDGSFVRSLEERADSRLFIRTLQTFADGLGLATVAECVEDDRVATLAVKLGVNYLQGFHYGSPSAARPARAFPPTALPAPKRVVGLA